MTGSNCRRALLPLPCRHVLLPLPCRHLLPVLTIGAAALPLLCAAASDAGLFERVTGSWALLDCDQPAVLVSNDNANTHTQCLAACQSLDAQEQMRQWLKHWVCGFTFRGTGSSKTFEPAPGFKYPPLARPTGPLTTPVAAPRVGLGGIELEAAHVGVSAVCHVHRTQDIRIRCHRY